MHDEPLLIKACLDNPTDNTVRLAYADWLEEYGTTDQHCARSEWIRLTCAKTRKSTVNRQPGERDWMGQNAHRLWPTLISAITGRLTGNDASWVNFHTLQLATGTISLLIPIPGHPRTSMVSATYHTRIVINASRGITKRVYLPFMHASKIAPLVVRDEPYASLNTHVVSSSIVQVHHDSSVKLHSDWFRRRGLMAVWEAIEGHSGWTHDPHNKNSTKSFPYLVGFEYTEVIKQIRERVDVALTEWARSQNTGR